jgi:hypothetical protein
MQAKVFFQSRVLLSDQFYLFPRVYVENVRARQDIEFFNVIPV